MQSATPAQGESPEQVQQVEEVNSVTATESTQETEVEAPEGGEGEKKTPWFQKRINEVTRERYEAKRQADEAQQQAAYYRDIAERLQNGEAIEQKQVDVEALAQQKAAQMMADRHFNDSCNKVYEQGKAEFPNFDQAVSNLQLVGASRDFLALVADSEVGAKLINHLGADLDEAARLTSLPPLQMARELTKLEFKLNQPKVKPVSKAPPPISAVGGNASDSGVSDDLPVDEWMRRERERMRKRGQ